LETLLKYNFDESRNKWYAVNTFYRHEKKVHEMLSEKAYEAYLPLVKKIKRYKSKLKSYEVPLINNYVFVKTDYTEFINIRNINGVIRFVKIGDKISVIPEQEINYLKLITGEINNIRSEPINNEGVIGKDIIISEGPLLGIKGKVVDVGNKNTIVVELSKLGIYLRFEVDSRIVKFIEL
jgi:transcription antitermination factor NusG